MRLLFFTFLLFTCYFLLTPTVEAVGEFSISYDNFYEVDQNFNLNVEQGVKITNLTTQYYVSEFTISVGNIKIESPIASDETGPIPASVDFTGNQSLIKLKFKTPVVGKGQVKNFTIKYLAPELVNKVGRILEVSIPKLTAAENIEQFNVRLTVPASVGPAAFISPEPVSIQSDGFGGKNTYSFDKSKLLKSGVTAAFGEKQVFSFNLTYHLQSPKSVKTEIALPPDNAYQKVLIEKIDPTPLDVREDSDGNWLAVYELGGGKQKDVTVAGFVEIYPKPKFKSQKPEDLQNYLKPTQYWEVNDSYFVEKAAELKTPAQIYDFVTSFLSYNQERLTAQTVERLGAAAAVANSANAVCMEFTDLFITMARAAQIPAREVNGFAASSNERLRPRSLANLGGDILHAWPEYWDSAEQNWVQVDPTWGSTSGGVDYFSKMDFAHIAFVHKGLSSTYPVPAGGYKVDPTKSGDVKVEATQELPQATFRPTLSIDFPKTVLSGLTTEGKVIIKNLSNQALNLGPAQFTTKNLTLKSRQVVDLGILPPAASREIKVQVASARLLTNTKGEIQVIAGSQTAKAAIYIRPSLFFILAASLLGMITLLGVAAGSALIFKRLPRQRF